MILTQTPPRLSLDEGPYRIAVPKIQGGSASSISTRRIVVADDDRNHRQVIEELLTEAGYDVEGAADGLEALAAIDRTPPALLVLDLRMPKLDGLGVLERLGRTRRNFPIIVLTALHDADDEALARGATRIVNKPVSIDTLLEAVQQLM